MFVGSGGSFPSGVFSKREGAESWIRSRRLTGVLTFYPIDKGVYEWAIENEYFTPKRPHEFESEFIGRFSCAQLEHYHYEDGEE